MFEFDPAGRTDAWQPRPLQLDGQQRALYQALHAKSDRLAGMYWGALAVFADTSNPDRLALAAHDLREVMEKIPGLFDVPTPAHDESLMREVRALEDCWKGTLRRTKCRNSEEWNGSIDGPLSKMLLRLHNFFSWLEMHYPRRKAEIAATLRKLDPSGRELPSPLQDLNVARWVKIRDFFVGVAHHKKSTTGEEFASWLWALEDLLLNQLRPRTFEDLDAIDKIIQEGETDA